MDEAEFRRLLQFGLGRPILYARDHDVRIFRDVILDACLHCYAYDAQIEGTRASYMLDLLDFVPEKEFYCEAVLNALPGSGDDYDAMQRFHFAACLALDGDERAKRLMYESYKPGPKMGEGIGIEFVEMDGEDGLIFVAEKMGALITRTVGKVDVGWLLYASEEKLGKELVRDTLSEAAQNNRHIARFRSSAAADEDGPRGSKYADLINASYEALKPELSNLTFYWVASWGKRASPTDIEKAAHGLADAQNAKERAAHLWIFAKRRFPFDIQPLLRLVDVEEERVGFASLEALTQIEHPRVRELAFHLMDTRAASRGTAANLLAVNFKPGDHTVLLQWFETEKDLDIRHSLGLHLIDFWAHHPDQTTEPPMLLARYGHDPCSFCRRSTVARMIELGILTEELRLECAWDADDEVRKLVGAEDGIREN
jgi:hypothetical protein